MSNPFSVSGVSSSSSIAPAKERDLNETAGTAAYSGQNLFGNDTDISRAHHLPEGCNREFGLG